MKGRKAKIIGAVIASTFLSASIAITASVALFVKHGESDGSYGEISLRSYYECGTGRLPGTNGRDDPGDPYVITRPRHLYNLSRLQGLGVYKEPTYFQLGKEGLGGADPEEGPLCYLNDSSSTTVPFLDMRSSDYNYERIVSIGTESSPFYGIFNGNNIEIKNLKVFADPEDIGLFGYTAHGSVVKDLFLDNITINSLGYTSEYANLYGESSTAGTGVRVDYSYKGVEKTFTVGAEPTARYNFDVSDYFDGDHSAAALPDSLPTITATWPSTYQYKLQSSGDFVSVSGRSITIEIGEVFKKFDDNKSDLASGVELTANSTASVIAYTVDNLGLEHSKVVFTLEFDFTLSPETPTEINMLVKLAPDHGNNIGFLIGHCDGTVQNCYVHDGTFNMNNNAGGAISGTYNSLAHKSSYGLIGHIGGTVYNRAGLESGAMTNAGKDVGVLNFTTIYDDIVGPSSFGGSASPTDGITYTPKETTQYEEFLRRSGTPEDFDYFTKNKDYVSFRGRKVISSETNEDLGVFTIATDEQTAGTYGDCGVNLDYSVIHDEGVDIDYLYYATGEYNKEYVEGKLGHRTSGAVGSNAFRKYALAMDQDNPDEFLLGHHLPSPTEVTVESFAERESHQNYFFRFQLTPDYRENDNETFYFSDVDVDTPGGSFISKYFEYKLVNQDFLPIPAEDPKCGVMLRTADTSDPSSREIESFRASFQNPDLSYPTDAVSSGIKKIMCLSDEMDNLAANMVNFEITTDVANVTVVAAPSDSSKSSALGVYKFDEDKVLHYETDDSRRYWNKPFDDPDFAFFMPKADKLSYFDYKTYDSGDNHIGQIGKYTTSDPSSFEEATVHTDTTDASSEPRAIAGKPRLFVHTFKLTKGRYAFGGATGADRDGMCPPKIYYVCAQGQERGQLEFNTNVFSSDDIVKDIDFLKNPRFTYSEGTLTKNIYLKDEDGYDEYSAAYSASSKRLEHQRCYTMFSKDPLRSSFAANPSDVSIAYNTLTSTLNVTSDTSSTITRLAFTNYGTTITYGTPPVSMGVPNTYISYLNGTRKNDDKLVFPETEE